MFIILWYPPLKRNYRSHLNRLSLFSVEPARVNCLSCTTRKGGNLWEASEIIQRICCKCCFTLHGKSPSIVLPKWRRESSYQINCYKIRFLMAIIQMIFNFNKTFANFPLDDFRFPSLFAEIESLFMSHRCFVFDILEQEICGGENITIKIFINWVVVF